METAYSIFVLIVAALIWVLVTGCGSVEQAETIDIVPVAPPADAGAEDPVSDHATETVDPAPPPADTAPRIEYRDRVETVEVEKIPDDLKATIANVRRAQLDLSRRIMEFAVTGRGSIKRYALAGVELSRVLGWMEERVGAEQKPPPANDESSSDDAEGEPDQQDQPPAPLPEGEAGNVSLRAIEALSNLDRILAQDD